MSLELWRAFTRGYFLLTRPTLGDWQRRWYRDPGSAWWEQ